MSSEVLQGSSECDGYPGKGAQHRTPCRKPRNASCPFRSELHRLGARVVIQIANVIDQTEIDTMRHNGLCLDGPPQRGHAVRSVGDRAVDLCQPDILR